MFSGQIFLFALYFLIVKIVKSDGDIHDSLVFQRDFLLHQLTAEIESWMGGNVTEDANTKCRNQLLTIYNESYDGVFDAWGHLPVGLLSGKLCSIGDFDSCIAIKEDFVRGKFCKAFIQLPDQSEFIRIGICIPEVCDKSFIRKIFSKDVKDWKIYVDFCYEGKTFNQFTYICFGIGSILSTLVIASSVYDYISRGNLRRNELLLSWSLQKNLKKTFDLSTNSNDHFDCIDGIRVLTMMWVMYYHTYIVVYRSQYTEFAGDTNPQRTNVLVHSGLIGVDTFFCLGGFLLAFSLFKKWEQDGRFYFKQLVIRRYFRLVPPMMMVIFVVNGVLGLVDGSNFISFTNMSNCMTNWWIVALMLQNWMEGVSFLLNFCIQFILCGD